MRCALARYDLAALCGSGPASRPRRRLSVSVVVFVVIRQSRGFRCAARLRLAASWSASSRDFIGQEKRALPSRVKARGRSAGKRRRRFPSITARVDTVGCVRLFVRSSSEAMPPSPPCRGCRAKRPFMYSCHRALGLRPCEKKNRAVCGKAAWTQKKGTPPFMGGVHMKKRKEYLTDGQRRRSSSVRSALGQACLSFGGCDSMRHGAAKRSRDMGCASFLRVGRDASEKVFRRSVG